MTFPGLPWIDWLLLAVLAASVVVGFARGLVYEALALAGWVVAWFAAQWAAPQLAPHLPLGEPGSALQLGAAFALTFFLALVVWGLLARLVQMLVHATPLSLLDRVLGSGFGVFRGLVLLLAVATVVTLTPAAQSEPWRGSHGAQLLGQALDSLKPLLPESAARLLPA
jgi:membrane protein required for colicin V production